ncbi:GNAT family N-acetyltransferase [Microbacteriaceae bacterium VKM Ac-2854]|nr:GNAT family N-acetyltransferase [Microbacteriaceae bacterium VKM Ac-2854]
MIIELRPATATDAAWIAELRAEVMRPDLERVGVFSPVRVRRRFLDAFDSAHTSVIVLDGVDVGSVAVRPDADAHWVEHFYLAVSAQGRGVGGVVLRRVLGTLPGTVRIDVLRGSRARRLYERHGFRHESFDGVDEFLRLR